MILGLSILAYCIVGFCIALGMRVVWLRGNPNDRDLDFNTSMLFMFWPLYIAFYVFAAVAYAVASACYAVAWPFLRIVERVDKAAGRDVEPVYEQNIGVPVVESE